VVGGLDAYFAGKEAVGVDECGIERSTVWFEKPVMHGACTGAYKPELIKVGHIVVIVGDVALGGYFADGH
jgi:hypothetical protein